MSLNPDADCNPASSNEAMDEATYGLGPLVIGLLLSFVSICWISVMTTHRMTAILTSGSVSTPGTDLFGLLFNVVLRYMFDAAS